ncbi:hypothetical protein CONPUDRAFT_166095 [Coniophora puteana RWD-64-598 SS2]|uniref:Actin-like ATPase domain-containing protein n=1 Tax=Coniophora puteana (strain RWD-64-598) TaxID=741705 RepID=A0A5M3MNJ6_CONPW|nr:uncharacterized protein CONPUDRAFT_166095 [Coniophora puteana RWD-64-598 SS2]EIW80616.1 hypothetical protein CONPUDRAFT_166095 [Coniophora puteana RWD-64-598 SS2]
MLERRPYQGLSRKLVLAFDVGTTFSGVSFCVLDPGEVPKIQGVSRYPAQEHVGGDSKIPSILYYDQAHQVRAVGAEALQEHIVEQAEDEQWIRLEWWKMHLRSKHLTSGHIKDSDIPPLPNGLTALQVLADFMAYLFRCAKQYIIETYANGQQHWDSFGDAIDFVLPHPNGWEGPQQSQIRRAAVLAMLVPDLPSAQERVRLVTEGEASLHYCVSNVLASDTWSRLPIEKPVDGSSTLSEPGFGGDRGVIIVDAGGGTIDVSAYSMVSDDNTSTPVSFEEIAPAECRLQGSVFVTRRANALLNEKLEGSRFAAPDYISQMTEAFDKTTKLRFRSKDEPSYVKFGTMRDKDQSFGIRSGQLRLQGHDVAALFEPSIQSVVNVINQQRKASTMEIGFVFLVGGFAASGYLFSQLQVRLASTGLSLSRPDSHANKAVADGAMSYYIDHLVTSRVAKYTYGMKMNVAFDPTNRQHVARWNTVFTWPSGGQRVPGVFDTILAKGSRVSEAQEFRRSYHEETMSNIRFPVLHATVLVYRGTNSPPIFVDEAQGAFSTACSVQADTSVASKALQALRGYSSTYYVLWYDIILKFGLTELQAQISWIENGVEKRSPASVIYEEEIGS